MKNEIIAMVAISKLLERDSNVNVYELVPREKREMIAEKYGSKYPEFFNMNRSDEDEFEELVKNACLHFLQLILEDIENEQV